MTPADKRAKADRERKRRECLGYSMLSLAKQRAKKKQLPFDLDEEYLKSIIPDKCPVLGVSLKRGVGKFDSCSPSLDRIVPELGYVKGNVRVISDRANRIKRDATLEELRAIVKYVEETKGS
jgi:hypothetical protein